jgi:ankyrin repeat protein
MLVMTSLFGEPRSDRVVPRSRCCAVLVASGVVALLTACSAPPTLASAVEDDDDAVRTFFASTPTVDVDAPDMYGEAPLHQAALRCNAAVITVLAAHHANVGALDARGRTPLAIASDLECTEAVYALVVAGADPNQPSHPEQTPPLHVAARRGARPVVELLLGAGADVNRTNAWGQTPLHFASRAGRGRAEDISALLLARGARIDTQDAQGFTPLHAAAAHDKPELVAQLLEHGADVDARTNRGSTPLDLALDLQSDLVAELLLARKAPRSRSVALPPLHQAAAVDDADWARRLLSGGADPALVAGGETALDLARAKRSERVELLLTDQRRSALRPTLVPGR